MTVYDDGSGPALFVGGDFPKAGTQDPANNVAKWDGTTWTTLGGGTNGPVDSMTVYDDGSGSALYVGGSFTVAGGVAANRIARWNGSSWSAVGSGTSGSVLAFATFDVHDHSGPALYAGGDFRHLTRRQLPRPLGLLAPILRQGARAMAAGPRPPARPLSD
jgi:hypothetical protein